MCDEVGYPTAPEAWYADSPIYVANEMPLEEVRAFASGLEGYENYWIDREHNGWITVGFVDVDVEAHQALLEEEFPGVGVVAVEMPYTYQELDRIRQGIAERLPEDMDASNMFEARGVVIVWVGRLTPERIASAEEIVGDDPACLMGRETPEPGPQSAGGDGWTYLATVDTWISNRPVVIASADRLADVWNELGVEGPPADVDFETHIVVAFPVTYSPPCDETRFDEVVVEDDLVHPVIADLSTEFVCDEIAYTRSYLIAVERGILPPAPFRISYEKGTVLEIRVTADLRQPGSIPAEGEVEEFTPELLRTSTPTPAIIEVGFPSPFTIDVSCGIDYLGVINSVGWHMADGSDELPTAWEEATVDGLLDLELLMTDGPKPTLKATAGGHTVEYLPGPDAGSPCD